jgi:predicted kinase
VELVIFIGLQASGKSTFFRTYFAETHVLVSKDLFRNNKKPDRRQAQLIDEAYETGRSVVVDNTNPTVEDRARLIEQGRYYGAEVIGYYFQSDVRGCWERNQTRSGKAKVPDIAIYSTVKKLQLPSYDEGFDKLFYVEIVENNRFEVRSWIEDEMNRGK